MFKVEKITKSKTAGNTKIELSITAEDLANFTHGFDIIFDNALPSLLQEGVLNEDSTNKIQCAAYSKNNLSHVLQSLLIDD